MAPGHQVARAFLDALLAAPHRSPSQSLNLVAIAAAHHNGLRVILG